MRLISKIMFFCCGNHEPRQHYLLVHRNKIGETIVRTTDDLEKETALLEDPDSSLRPIQLSQYNDLLAQCRLQNRRFQDVSFPANASSLGEVGAGAVKWKRISEFISYPTLFDHKIEPSDVIHRTSGDCYLLSAMAALAESPTLIKNVFHGQGYNEEGIYRVVLSVEGSVQEVVVDDFIPLHQDGSPIFCQPKVRDLTGEFWTLILEKAWAKAKGSYARIMEGTPSQLFRAVTYCPAESLAFRDKEAEKVWEILSLHTSHQQPFCATTKDLVSKYSGLISEHTYTVLAVTEVCLPEHANSSAPGRHRMVKLRNPWAAEGDLGWQGRGGNQDREFWELVEQDEEVVCFRRPPGAGDYGVFYMLFADFMTCFNQLHYCSSYKNTKTSSAILHSEKARGTFYELTIPSRNTYTFELVQADINEQTQQQREQEGPCRSTLVLLSDQEGRLAFQGGIMKLNSTSTSLVLNLRPGNYLLYALLEPTREHGYFPPSAVVNLHGSVLVPLGQVSSLRCENALREAFLSDGLAHEKKIVHNNGLMTVSYRLLFQQGGFAYLVLHNDAGSDKCFVVNYDEQEFTKAHLQVLEPQKHDRNFDIRVQPGHDMIILVRALNQKVNAWNFPPRMTLNLEPLR